MRAMEYTPVQCRCEPRGQWTLVQWCVIHRTQIEPTKKLTDAECAAEYWRAEADVARMDWGGHEEDDRDDPTYTMSFKSEPVWGRLATWHRFATQPHASEVEA